MASDKLTAALFNLVNVISSRLSQQENHNLISSSSSDISNFQILSILPRLLLTMDDYKLPLTKSDLRPEGILEAASVRHCIVGDLIVLALGYPLVPCDFQLAIADDNWKLPDQLWLCAAIKKSPKLMRDSLPKVQPKRAKRAGPVIDFYLTMLVNGRQARLLCLQNSGISI